MQGASHDPIAPADRMIEAVDSGSGSQAARQRMYRHQHAAEVMRARSILAVAFVLWIVTGIPIDVLTHGVLGSGSLAFVIGVRVATSLVHAGVLALLYRRPLPAPAIANAAIASVFPISAASIMLIATHMGGLTSVYVTVVFVGIMVQVTAAPGPWQRGAVLVGATVGVYIIGLVTAGAFDGQIRAQLADPIARTTFLVECAVLVAAAIVVAWAGHVLWSLRRSVFESRNLGRYRLARRIGKGGMGEVWRATDRALRRDVALKILSPEHGRHPAAIARFEREIQATSEVAHPNVVRIHDWGVTDDGVWYYAMDLLEGVDLATAIRQCGPMPAALVSHLGAGVAAGLAEAHRRGVIHRDIKPGNLFVVAQAREPVRVELLDFGIARVEADSELTQAGAMMGTPAFMAPEVIAGAPGGIPGDVYGLSASLYFALTGAAPREANHVPASAMVAGVPAQLDDLLVAALDAEPSRRPSVDEVVRTLVAAGPWTDSWSLDRHVDPTEPDEPADPTVDPSAPATIAEHVRPRSV